MVAFHSIFSIQHSPPLSYLHGKKLIKYEEIDVGMNSKNIMNNVSIFKDNVGMISIFNE